MKCKICEQDNPGEACFCANCGAALGALADGRHHRVMTREKGKSVPF